VNMIKLYFLTLCLSLIGTVGGSIFVLTSNSINEMQVLALIGGVICIFGNFVAICMETTNS